MDIHQLKTFVAVAREGSITRASERLHLSQPATSAHVKAIEDELGVPLFDRTPKGMVLTAGGARLLAKAEQVLAAHRELADEARRMSGVLSGKLRLGAGSNTDHEAIGRLLTMLAERYPDLEVIFKHGTSSDVLAGIRDGSLDAGFYNEAAEPDADLGTVEVSRFAIYLVAAPGLVVATAGSGAGAEPNWKALAEHAWVYPATSACCGRVAERLFAANQIRPKRVVSVDREDITRTLVIGGVGVGLLHANRAHEAAARGEIELVYESKPPVRVLFAHLATRANDAMVSAAVSLVRGPPADPRE